MYPMVYHKVTIDTISNFAKKIDKIYENDDENIRSVGKRSR